MLENKIILFIIEGPSDEDALIVPLENELINKKIKTRVKVLHTDILTEYISENNNNFKITSANLMGELKELIETTLKKISLIKFKDIGKIIYITDTDDCFLKKELHSKNKKECLKTLFNKRNIELGKKNAKKVIPFEVIFMSQNLEHVLTGEIKEYSPEEKEKISTEFKDKCEKNFEEYKSFFMSSNIKKWKTYNESYEKIETTNERASNMNCLLEELEIS